MFRVSNLLLRIVESGSTLALLLVHQTYNLSRIKFAHVSRQVDCLCISWSSLKGYRMKPSMLRQKQPWIWIKKTTVANNSLRYNLRLPWRKKKGKEIRSSL